VLAAAYFIAGIFVAGIGLAGASVGLIILTVFAAGFCIVGAQMGANAMAASYYPTAIRSTGVGWALGIGRIGSIIGPWLGGLILSFEWKTSSLFMTASIPALVAALAALTMAFHGTERTSVTRPSHAGNG
jgi:AAHS family 4-hydroxybenzoate transporter-like MFS transporter